MESHDAVSIVERVFPNPKDIGEGEYWAIYDFFASPDIENDPDLIMGCLEEFSGWATHLIDLMRKAGYGDQSTGQPENSVYRIWKPPDD